MSDRPQGPGWWQASDGRWYPGELHPSRLPPPGGPPPGTYPPGTYPPGTYPPGAYPPGAYPPGTYPYGTYPYGVPPYGASPPGTAPYGAIHPPPARRFAGRPLVLISALVVLGIGIIAVLIAGSTITVLRLTPLAISGAPGYTTVTGPAGLPLAEGMPWGRRCQPILFQADDTVPAQQVDLIQQAVESARALGIDVTFEDQNLGWSPSALYPPGQTSSTVEVVQIAATTGTPPVLPDGHDEHINFAWGANVAPDGRHEVLSGLDATIYLATVQGDPQATERSVRQLIAFSQGVGASTAPDSSITTGNTADAYSSRDLAAMQRMSGCAFEPTS